MRSRRSWPPRGRSTRRRTRSCWPRTRAAARTTSRSSCSGWAAATRPPRPPRSGPRAGRDRHPAQARAARLPGAPGAAPPQASRAPGPPGRRGTAAHRRRAGRPLRAQPPGLLRRHERRGPRHRVPGHPLRAAVRDRPLYGGLCERHARQGDSQRAPGTGPGPRVARPRGRRRTGARTRARPARRRSIPLMSARTRELFGLLPVSLLVAAGFAAVLSTRTENVSDGTLTYGAFFLGLCVLAHLFIRARLPDADPYMFPLAAVLAGIGLVLIYRIDAELAREQAQWFVVGLAFFCVTILLIDDHHVLERYRYTIAAASIGLLLIPRLPGIGAQVNGAYLAIKVGPIQFQPAEFAKLGIVIFLASDLRETGDIRVRPRLRPLPYQRQLLLWGVPAALTLLGITLLGLGVAGSVLLAVFLF